MLGHGIFSSPLGHRRISAVPKSDMDFPKEKAAPKNRLESLGV
jgi:hypothetical protein